MTDMLHRAPSTTPPARTVVRAAGEGEATWFLNALMTTKASTDETGGAYSLTEHLVTAASNPPRHVQLEEEEGFYVLEGEVELDIDDVTLTATPGTFALVPRGAEHAFRVLTPTARMLVICSGKRTANLESFFTTMGEPAGHRGLPEPAAPDADRLVELATSHGIAFV